MPDIFGQRYPYKYHSGTGGGSVQQIFKTPSLYERQPKE